MFDFEYKWEIYTPKEKRTYGYYMLPIVYGSDFIGRIEIVCDRKNGKMNVQNIWFEQGVRRTKSLDTSINKTIRRFAVFNDCAPIHTFYEKQLDK